MNLSHRQNLEGMPRVQFEVDSHETFCDPQGVTSEERNSELSRITKTPDWVWIKGLDVPRPIEFF